MELSDFFSKYQDVIISPQLYRQKPDRIKLGKQFYSLFEQRVKSAIVAIRSFSGLSGINNYIFIGLEDWDKWDEANSLLNSTNIVNQKPYLSYVLLPIVGVYFDRFPRHVDSKLKHTVPIWVYLKSNIVGVYQTIIDDQFLSGPQQDKNIDRLNATVYIQPKLADYIKLYMRISGDRFGNVEFSYATLTLEFKDKLNSGSKIPVPEDDNKTGRFSYKKKVYRKIDFEEEEPKKKYTTISPIKRKLARTDSSSF